MEINVLFLQRVIGLILAGLLFYSAIKLINVLKTKETALSMIFLHKKRVKSLFALLVFASLFTFLTGLLYIMDINVLFVETALGINVFILFVFTYLLQKLMKGDENQ
ncbi:hypothetical protein [Methanobacterium alcaliphilum]|uniref:hypothetical protein n=1 Tax=Methanobacterium alcaliphilum TaxID=392018 RepID=UPI00200B5CCA|nr:hypothetical protein [Methanobacterium alcaliphilum]MCK9151851.1 hypothetical protein [Methanobacterium alcaliphilum]